MDNVETMFWAGNDRPWHGLGTKVDNALTSIDALRMAELDWDVVSCPVATSLPEQDRFEIPALRANVRSLDGAVFGVVSDRYKIVQNREAFAFTDHLIKNDLGIEVTYETAGSLDHGRRIWLLAKMPVQKILGDQVVPYMVFTNSHDGKGAVRVAMTPVRVVCANTLAAGLAQARRTWSTRHMGNLESKMADAHDTLQLAQDYMSSLNETAEEWQQRRLTKREEGQLINELFPMSLEMSEKQRANSFLLRNAFQEIYESKPDIQGFRGTAWGMYNALADFETHLEPARNTLTFKERQFAAFIDGNPRLRIAEAFFAA